MPGRDLNGLALTEYDINKTQVTTPQATPASDALNPKVNSWVPGFVAGAGALASHFAQTPGQLQAGQSLMAYGTKQLEEEREEEKGRQGMASAMGLKPEQIKGNYKAYGEGLRANAEMERTKTEQKRTGLMEREVVVREQLAVQEVKNMEKQLELIGVQIKMGNSEAEWNQPYDLILGGSIVPVAKRDAGKLILQANQDEQQARYLDEQIQLSAAQRKVLEERVLVDIGGVKMRVSPETYATYTAHIKGAQIGANAQITSARIHEAGQFDSALLKAIMDKNATLKAGQTRSQTLQESQKTVTAAWDSLQLAGLKAGRFKPNDPSWRAPVQQVMAGAYALSRAEDVDPTTKALNEQRWASISEAVQRTFGWDDATTKNWELATAEKFQAVADAKQGPANDAFFTPPPAAAPGSAAGALKPQSSGSGFNGVFNLLAPKASAEPPAAPARPASKAAAALAERKPASTPYNIANEFSELKKAFGRK